MNIPPRARTAWCAARCSSPSPSSCATMHHGSAKIPSASWRRRASPAPRSRASCGTASSRRRWRWLPADFHVMGCAMRSGKLLRSREVPMTLKQLEAFYWAAKLGTFAIAARRLHVTQSSLSKRIAELETDLGQLLFDRASRRATLTAAGEILLQKAGAMLEFE